ncbi:neprilysin-2-like [Microplitis mediator]|uniref:neprilysin-2-like n=1 Tax=Microplitis mediator TaxID=375433 RepID=UPI002554AD2E|nr:neprilysin-2-like [Microplitis mediator]
MKLLMFDKSLGLLRQKKQRSVWKSTFFLIVSVGLVCLIYPINTSAAVVDTTRNDVAANKCTGNACTAEQTETAARILRYHDASIKPCDNFYRFACGNYKKTDKSNNYDYLESQKHDYLEKLIRKGISSDFKPYKLIDDIYKSCINDNAKGPQALDLLKRTMKKLGNWPILEANWKESTFNWIDFTGDAKKNGYNINYFIDWTPKPIYSGSRRSLRYTVTMADTHFDPSMPEKTTSQKRAYSDYMVKVARLLGANSGDLAKDMKDVYDFEEQLSKINVGDHPYQTANFTIAELQKQWPSIEWKRFVDKTLIPFVDANEKPILTVWNSTTLTELTQLMKKTPKRVQANYAIWKIVQYSAPYLTEEFREAHKTFHEQVGYVGIPADDDCLELAKKYAAYAAQYLYLDQYKSNQALVKNIIGFVKTGMINLIKESKVLDAKDKNKGIKTITEMPFTIGPSEKLSDRKELEKFYANAQVVKDNFLQTILNLNLFKMKNDFSIKIQLEIAPYGVSLLDNSALPEVFDGRLIHIPASMIPSPLFNENRPMYMNYGSSASYIAINIADALSDLGRGRQKDGTLLPNDQLDCFRRHYEDLSDETKKNNLRRNKFEEDLILQYIGFRTSRNSYKTYVAQHGSEKPLPGLSYSPEQLFWISFAQSYCSTYADLAEIRYLNNNQYSAPDYLQMKILSNVPEFSSDFQCPVGSNLNPAKKCTWW